MKDCKKHQIKKQLCYVLKFPLSKFVKFTGMQLSNQSERENLISYFYQLQKLDPVVKVFSNLAFRSYGKILKILNLSNKPLVIKN